MAREMGEVMLGWRKVIMMTYRTGEPTRERLNAMVLPTAVFLAVFVTPSLTAQTCSNTLVDGDRDFWEQFPTMTETWYRNMIAGYYNLQKNDWDEGWGWSKYNDPDPHLFEFCKMMSAGRLLFGGFDDTYSLQGGWWVQRMVNMNDPSSTAHPQLRVLSRRPNSLDVVFRLQSGQLRRLEFSPTYADCPAWNGNLTTYEHVSAQLATRKNAYLLASDPAVLSRTATTLDVFGRDHGKGLLHFHWDEASGWTVQDVTTLTVRTVPIGNIQRYFISTEPQAISRSEDSMDVFALDDFMHLIHYSWTQGVWSAEDVTQMLADGYHIVTDPVILRRNSDVMDVVGRTSFGHLIHYQWTQGAWSSTNVTTDVGDARLIEGTPTLVSPDNQSLLVYARSGWHLLMYFWTSLTGWGVLDMTGNDFIVEGDPVAVKRDRDHADVFIRDIYGHLIRSYYAADVGFDTEDLTRELGGFANDTWVDFKAIRIGGMPVAITPNANRIDVFALSPFHQLIHYFWTSELGWESENVHHAGFINTTLITTDPVVALRGSESLHVFSGHVIQLDDGGLVIDDNQFEQFYAAIGRTVNSWHTNKEYHRWAAGSLRGFRYEPKYEDEDIVAFTPASDKIEMRCLSFDYELALRAMTMVHEAAHANIWPNAHVDCPTADCSDCCDDWDFHGVRDPAGFLWGFIDNHSANQLSVEYLADVSEFFFDDLPLATIDLAQDVAQLMLDEQITNPPGWTIGTPRPVD